ncbi:serine/arginine repetitive matrix protein 1-like [Rhinopithecus roxellana]|uniref:serine/arginine repetitive matrix protein 1-like n=1 Tax=Rhinopithecus roxellana TaxID=61622 RepID=UPI0012374B60|nr:serine/arginine repetitive matrix protein 1-like [Rhinopithecus roxellana]
MPTPTPCATPRPAKQPQRRGRGWPSQGEGMSARESRRQRETRGGRKRACAPPPASGRRSRSSSGSSCRSRCSWEKRQRGRACSGRTGSLPSPSLLPPLPQTHFRSSRPCRRSSSGGSSRRRRRGVGRITHLTGPPPRAPARDAHRSPPPRAHFAVAVGREGPATGNGTRIAPLPFLPPSLRSAARPLGFRPLPLPQNPGWSRCRLAAAWLRGMVLSSGQSPGARRSRHRPREAPLPSLPRTGPRVAWALRLPAPGALGRGSFVVFVATAAAGTVCELRWPPLPTPRLPGPWARGGTWAPAPGGGGGARLPVAGAAAAGGVEEALLGSLGRAVLPAAAASASRCCCCCCCCCCRRGRCLRRGGGGGGGAFPVRLR